MAALMEAARQRSKKGQPKFKKPDITQFVPEQARDAWHRVTAAGMKLMYSPQMREEVMQEVKRDAPVPQKMADSVTGLMLLMDQQAQGGIPESAIFPAAMDLLGEAGEVLSAAGQTVTQEDYNEAAQLLFVNLGRKLGLSDEQMMGAAEKAAGGMENEPGEGPGHEQAEGSQGEGQEDQPGAQPDAADGGGMPMMMRRR